MGQALSVGPQGDDLRLDSRGAINGSLVTFQRSHTGAATRLSDNGRETRSPNADQEESSSERKGQRVRGWLCVPCFPPTSFISRSTTTELFMKTKIVRNVPKDRIRNHLPTRLRDRLVSAALKASSYTIMLFRMRQHVILSGTVKEALATFDSTESLVAVGPCFTLEALKLLEARKVLVLVASDYPWTDAS